MIMNILVVIYYENIFVEELYLTLWKRGNGVHTYPEGISPKVNVLAWLGAELANSSDADEHFPMCQNGNNLQISII